MQEMPCLYMFFVVACLQYDCFINVLNKYETKDVYIFPVLKLFLVDIRI